MVDQEMRDRLPEQFAAPQDHLQGFGQPTDFRTDLKDFAHLTLAKLAVPFGGHPERAANNS